MIDIAVDRVLHRLPELLDRERGLAVWLNTTALSTWEGPG